MIRLHDNVFVQILAVYLEDKVFQMFSSCISLSPLIIKLKGVRNNIN